MIKNVLILGASGDIGSAICKELAAQGYQLILHYYKNKQSIESILSEADEESVLQTVQADLTDVNETVKLCKAISYEVDAIIFVSGMAHFGLFQDVSMKEMDRMLSLHVKTPWLIVQHFLPGMIRKQSGKIIFVTSIWGDIGASNEVIYSSVKGAQNSFVRALAKEVGPSGISVNAISPGFIDTKMNAHLLSEEKAAIISDIPLNRPGLAADVANTAGFLISGKSDYIHGEIIRITGGW